MKNYNISYMRTLLILKLFFYWHIFCMESVKKEEIGDKVSHSAYRRRKKNIKKCIRQIKQCPSLWDNNNEYKLCGQLPNFIYQIADIELMIVVYIVQVPLRLHGGIRNTDEEEQGDGDAMYPGIIMANQTEQGLQIEVPDGLLPPNNPYRAIRVNVRRGRIADSEAGMCNEGASSNRDDSNNRGATASRSTPDDIRSTTDKTAGRSNLDNIRSTTDQTAGINTPDNIRSTTDKTAGRNTPDNIRSTTDAMASSKNDNKRSSSNDRVRTDQRSTTDNMDPIYNRSDTSNRQDTYSSDNTNNEYGMQACAAPGYTDVAENRTAGSSFQNTGRQRRQGMVTVKVYYQEEHRIWKVPRGTRVDDFIRSKDFISTVTSDWRIPQDDLWNMVLRDQNHQYETFETDCEIRFSRGHIDLFIY